MAIDSAAAVRLITGLTADELSADDITTLLELNDGFVKLAAADALESFAGTLATISVQADDISIDGSKRAAVLMARAKSLRAQAAVVEADDGFFFAVIDSPGGHPELTERECW